MDPVWSPIHAAPLADPLEVALSEIDVAIELVLRGQARRVRLCGLAAGERAAGPGLARAQAACVRFAVERGEAPAFAVSLLIGPAVDV
jgi:hypothetical protein